MEETRKGVERKRVGEEKIKTWGNIRNGKKDIAKQLILSGWSRNFWKIIKYFPRKQWNCLCPSYYCGLYKLGHYLVSSHF